MPKHIWAGATLAVPVILLAATSVATADNLTYYDQLDPQSSSVSVGEVCAGGSGSAPVAFRLVRQGSVNPNTWADGAVVAISAPSVTATAGTVSSGSTAVTLPGDWTTPDNGRFVSSDSVPVTVAVPADAVVGTSGSATLVYSGVGDGAEGGTTSRSDSVGVTWSVKDCSTAPANRAPVVSQQALDAGGDEGSELTAGGGFTDPDGDPLTLTQVAGAGSISDLGDGSFTWSLTPDDNGSGTVTVRASDGELTAEQSFGWSASNVAPGVGPVQATLTGACSVAVSAPFSDPGSADTHSAGISWGDGSGDTVDPAASPVTGSHTWTTAGPHTVGVTVTDDDGGVGSASTEVGTRNVPSQLAQPINSSGSRSGFKLGSTIPVKITVADCAGAQVSSLAPTVSITRLDSNPDSPVTETGATAVPTNGQQMRWSADGEQYVYNLSTKLSQQYGTSLSAGTYRITVSDPSFFAPVTAMVDLRK